MPAIDATSLSVPILLVLGGMSSVALRSRAGSTGPRAEAPYRRSVEVLSPPGGARSARREVRIQVLFIDLPDTMSAEPIRSMAVRRTRVREEHGHEEAEEGSA